MNQNKTVTQITPNIWRVTRWGNQLEQRESLFVREPENSFVQDSLFQYREKENGLGEFLLAGRVVLSESDTPFTQGFTIASEDGIYGLGIHQHQPLNRRRLVCQMIQKNGKITAIPFFTSTGGYAVLFDSCAYMSIGIDKPCTSEYLEDYEPDTDTPNQIQIYADDSDTFTYYVILGRNIDNQIDGYRLLTGKSPLLAKWAYGFFQSREHYKTQEELLQIAHEFRKRKIPLDCIVQDWNYWGDLGWNALEWDLKNYPDAKAMIEELHRMDMKIMLSVWPSFGPETAICKELEKAGGILEKPDRRGENWGRVHDPLNADAADLIWNRMEKNLFDAGVDAWWLDSTEPAFETDSSLNLLECSPSAKGDNHRYLNHFALCSSRNVYQRQRAKTSEKRVYILTRSGYAGQQASAVSTWTGDIKATWEVFRQQISSLLSFSASGIPYSTTDIGAFFVEYPDGNQNPEYRELYTRWFWFGAFSPLFRSHGTSTPREMWFFGEPGSEFYEAQMAASRMRYALMPYIYATAFRVYDQNQTLMRPLVMDFPNDKKVRDIFDSYLFGPSLLVHIITSYQQRQAQVYLPEGSDWVDFFTGKRYFGGQTVTVDAPFNQTPIFAKAGSLILTAEPAECTAQQNEYNLKLQLFSGADAQTFCYIDDGDNYRYESGHYVKIPFIWNEHSHTLIIDTPTGDIDAFDTNKEIEIYINRRYCTSVTYAGQSISLEL